MLHNSMLLAGHRRVLFEWSFCQTPHLCHGQKIVGDGHPSHHGKNLDILGIWIYIWYNIYIYMTYKYNIYSIYTVYIQYIYSIYTVYIQYIYSIYIYTYNQSSFPFSPSLMIWNCPLISLIMDWQPSLNIGHLSMIWPCYISYDSHPPPPRFCTFVT